MGFAIVILWCFWGWGIGQKNRAVSVGGLAAFLGDCICWGFIRQASAEFFRRAFFCVLSNGGRCYIMRMGTVAGG